MYLFLARNLTENSDDNEKRVIAEDMLAQNGAITSVKEMSIILLEVSLRLSD